MRATRQRRHLALMKEGGELYVFVYTDEHRTELLRTFGRFATRPDLSFTWYDAAVMSGRVKEKATKAGGE